MSETCKLITSNMEQCLNYKLFRFLKAEAIRMSIDHRNESQIYEEPNICPTEVEHGETKVFSAKEFVDDLLEHGSNTPCDRTMKQFNGDDGLPTFFNTDKFKIGQKFFHKHIFAIFLCKFLGLIVTLSSPSILAVLQMTKMSGSNLTAYRRYVATLLHMKLWYDIELSPDSRSMKSIKKVKDMHNAASMRSRGIEKPPITQLDMVLTQFGFMGFAISRAENMGVHKSTSEEQEGFIHFWRVLASLMGIQDRFNLCRESSEETREICEELINRVFYPFIKKKDKDFLEMTSYLVHGLWNVFPSLNYNVFLTFLYENLKPKNNLNNNDISDEEKYFNLTSVESFYYRVICNTNYLLRYDFIRVFFNFLHIITIWILEHFPFIAIYAFGYKNALVSIEPIQVRSPSN